MRSRLAELIQDAGITAWVHAQRVTGPAAAVSWRATDEVAIASLYKLPLAIVWADLVVAGELDPHARMVVRPGERSPGPTGLSALADEVALSQRDTVRMMLALSDNAAADVILDLVGIDRVVAWLRSHGFTSTRLRHGSAVSLRVVQRETGVPDPVRAQHALADVDRDVMTSEYDAALASRSTAAELCGMLRWLWSRPEEPHEWVRLSMGLQAWRHRIGSGFPHDDVAVYGKTGTLVRLRHEAAVVEYPGEHPVAVAVLTLAARAERHLPRVDAAIGALAREAVAPLRLAKDEVG